MVVRIATDHPEAVPDARTESVAAPVARAAGVRTPRLIAFDDARRILDRPYSVWERVHGATLGRLPAKQRTNATTWRAVGRQLAVLHVGVERCDDPHGYLDEPARALDLRDRLAQLESIGHVGGPLADALGDLIDRLRPALDPTGAPRFLHNDVHAMNVMCAEDGTLSALLDWGDAGWGDPSVELAQVQLEVVPHVLAGHREVAPGMLGEATEARVVWDKIDLALEARRHDRRHPIPVAAFRSFLESRGGGSSVG